MKEVLLLVFLKFIANIETTKPKSVNLALQTVLEFDPKSNAADVKFLDNVQELLDKVKNVLRNNKTGRRYVTENKNIKFTDFVKSVIEIIKSYDDKDLEDVFAVFDSEIRKYHYRGCKFYELLEDQAVRRFVANKLEDIKDKPAEKLRQNLDNAIQSLEDAKFNGRRTEFLDYVNSLYRQDSTEKLHEFLNNLQTYSSKTKRTNLNLIKLVQNGIRSVIFDHYSRLNANARRNLKIKLETSWRDPTNDRIERNIWTVEYTSRFSDLMKYRNKNDKTRYTNSLTTKPIATRKPTTTDSESNDNDEAITTGYTDREFSTENESKEVYFNKDKNIKNYDSDNDFDTVTTKSITQDLTSESDSDSDEIPTTKLKPRKHKDKKHKQKITANNKRFKIESTTRKSRLSTLWEEKMINKKGKKLKSKSKTHLRTGDDTPRVIADSETIVNVQRAISSEDSIEPTNKGIRETTKIQTWQQTTTTPGQYKPTTLKKSRKNVAKLISLEDFQSGISIESFEIKRRSLLDIQNNSDQTETKRNVLRRINQLEKQMEEVKIKIDTKLANTSKDTFTLLDYWKGTTAATNTTTTTTITTETTKQSLTTATPLETTTKTTTITIESNKSIESTTEKENTTTQTINERESVEDKNTTISEQNKQNLDVPEDDNDFGIDSDIQIDKLIKKYNISVTEPTSYDIDKLLDKTKPENSKESQVKDVIESDLRKVFGNRRDNARLEAYQDLNAVLDLGERIE